MKPTNTLQRKATQMLSAALLLGALFFFHAVIGQPLIVSTFAGDSGQGSVNGVGPAARFSSPWGVAVDISGNVYIADTGNHVIRKITSGGAVTNLAGLSGVSGSDDGAGSNARFNKPQGIIVDNAGTVYVTDTGNFTIRKITAGGVVTTLAGLAGVSGTNNGTGTTARFAQPEGIGITSSTLIYVADTWNHAIRQVTQAGVVSTFVGTLGTPGAVNGTSTVAQFNQPQGMAIDSSGNIYVGDTGNQLIRRITSAGVVTTLAGSVTNYGAANGSGTNAFFWDPQGVAVDSSGNVYVADSFNNTIRKVTPGGTVTTFAGGAGLIGSVNGTNTSARFWQPQGVAVDFSGNVYVADTGNSILRKITAAGAVSTLAGSASIGSADGTALNARFFWPGGVAADTSGNLYVADTQNSTIRKINPSGVVETFAGTAGITGMSNDVRTAARFNGPQGIAIDSSNNVYVADTANHTVRKITSNGTTSTFAGTAGTNGIADGPGNTAQFSFPQSVAVDGLGNIYVADTGNHLVRKISAGGVVTTLAGERGVCGTSDGTGPSVGTNIARFNAPAGVAVDNSGNVYVADTQNHTIRKVTAAGVVSTLAGLAGSFGSTDGTNAAARFNRPMAIVIDANSNLFVLDSGNHVVRKLVPSETNWVVTTVAGQSTVVGAADGAGSNAQFLYPTALTFDSAGVLYIADSGNNTIRAAIATVPPSIIQQPRSQTSLQGSTATLTVLASGTGPLSYWWYSNGVPYLQLTNTFASTGAGSYSVLVSNVAGTAMSDIATLSFVNYPSEGRFEAVQLSGTSMQLSMSGAPNTNYVLQVSGDLVTWTNLVDLSNTNGLFQYSEPIVSTNPARFYRLQRGL